MVEGYLHVFFGPTTDLGKIEPGVCTIKRRTIPPKNIQKPRNANNF